MAPTPARGAAASPDPHNGWHSSNGGRDIAGAFAPGILGTYAPRGCRTSKHDLPVAAKGTWNLSGGGAPACSDQCAYSAFSCYNGHDDSTNYSAADYGPLDVPTPLLTYINPSALNPFDEAPMPPKYGLPAPSWPKGTNPLLSYWVDCNTTHIPPHSTAWQSRRHGHRRMGNKLQREIQYDITGAWSRMPLRESTTRVWAR